MNLKKSYFAVSFLWSVIAKLLDAVIKFFTIPILLKTFGVDHYGVLTLAMSINAYINLLEMGMNVGAIKFLSQWIGEGRYDLVDRVARTNVTFYFSIAVVNILILLSLYLFGSNLFNITAVQFVTLQQLLLILMAFSVFSWCNFAFNQLIIANQKIGFIQKISAIRSVINLTLVLLTIWLHLSISQYFFLFILFSALLIVPNYILCRRDHLITSIKLCFYWEDFRKVFKYSLGVFALSFFQLTATYSRPIILGIFSINSGLILSEYKIIEVVPAFIISIMGMLIAIILPKVSKNMGSNNLEANKTIAYSGTSYSTILLCVIAFPFLLNADKFIEVYVGSEFLYLSLWFKLWVASLFLYLYNMPISALVLASGKTNKLVLTTSIACVISLIVNAVACPRFGVGSAVIGYIIYLIITTLADYFYFIPRVLSLNPVIVIRKFFTPFILAVIIFLGVKYIPYSFSNIYTSIIVTSLLFEVIYIGSMWFMYKYKKI